MITEQTVNNHEDLLKVVDGMLKEVGLDRKDTGGKMTFAGMDPIRETVLKVGAASACVIATNAALNAIIWKARSGEGQDIHVDLRKAWAMQSAWQDVLADCTMVNGVSRMGNPDWFGENSNIQILPTLDKQFVMVSAPYPAQMLKMCKIFNTGFTHDQLAQASRKQTADDLEAMGNSAMLPITKVRTQEQFQASEQWGNHASTPMIHIEKIGDSAPEPLGAGERPLSGIRSLSMVHIVAGPTIQRTLAAQGADCLNIHPPTWLEAPEFLFNCFAGVRHAAVDTPLDRGRDQLYKLIKDADVFIENLRPGLAAQEGYSPEELAAFRPGIICANVKLNTPGPWSGMCGFDMNGAALTGVLTECGTPDQPARPRAVNVINDFLTGYMAAIGIQAALLRRATEGGSYKVSVSLAQTGTFLLSLGVIPKGDLLDIENMGPEHQWMKPNLVTGPTPWGEYTRMGTQVEMSKTPEFWTDPMCVPPGYNLPEWLPRPQTKAKK